jgi:hypothetical protein
VPDEPGWPSGSDVVRLLRSLPRDELPSLVEVLDLAHAAVQSAIGRRVVHLHAMIARAIMAGLHPGPLVGQWDELVEGLVGSPFRLVVTELVAEAQDILSAEGPV